jgi:two-component system cell cycle response regulator DivK
VLLDLAMPDMPGSEVLKRLGDDPITAGIPVVVVTAMALDARQHAALLEQAAAIVFKGDLTRDVLAAAVRDVARRAPAGAGRDADRPGDNSHPR